MRTFFPILCSAVALAAVHAQQSGDYDPVAAVTAAYWASVAYCPGQDISSWSCGKACHEVAPGMTSAIVQYKSDRNVLSFVAKPNNSDVTHIVFRGTEPASLTDWIKDDLNFFPIKPYPKCVGCELHGGFYDSYFDLKPGILTAFEQLGTKPGDKLQITGHSLGAAMATIAAYDMLADGYKIAQSYTFGTPRVGNQAFADAYDAALGKQTMYRYVLCITHPPTQLGRTAPAHRMLTPPPSLLSFQSNPQC